MSQELKDINTSDDDFEIISIDSQEETLRGSIISNSTETLQEQHDVAECRIVPSSSDAERHSEWALEPLNKIINSNAERFECQGPIFHINFESTDHDVVLSAWMRGFPEEYHQLLNCYTCRQFLRVYGDLCVVNKNGTLQPLFWPRDVSAIPPFYKTSVLNILELFDSRSVGDEFKLRAHKGRRLGKQLAGGWTHLSALLSKAPLVREVDSMASQNTQTSYEMLDRVLADYNLEIIDRAHHMLHKSQLPYSQSSKAPISFLKQAAQAIAIHKPTDDIRRKNLITLYARTAFTGSLSSLRGGVVGCLLGWIKEGDNFETLRSKWAAMLDPLAYLRPQSELSYGNMVSAEKMFQQLGYTAHDLARAYLAPDQIPESAKLWFSMTSMTSPSKNTLKMPIFGHLMDKAGSRHISAEYGPETKTSFRNFALRVLPEAASVELRLENIICPTFLTVGRANSKPLMSFHSDTNTASWYYWGSSERVERAALQPGWTSVLAIISFPHMWEHISPLDAFDQDKMENFKHNRHDIRYLFCLKDIKDLRSRDRGLGLFPTLMRSEFHPFRRTIERYSNEGSLEQLPEGMQHIGGVAVSKEHLVRGEESLKLRVRDHEGHISVYDLCLFD